MLKPQHQIPPLPEVGHPESYYAREVHHADKRGDVHAREALKVGQYITLGLDPRLKWPQKLRYFQHALRRHCNPPDMADDEVWMFYRNLSHLIREQCGREALRLATEADDLYAERLRMGTSRERISSDAKVLFATLTNDATKCPEHFTEDDWEALRILRNQWVMDFGTSQSAGR